jgi:hypothetical protein
MYNSDESTITGMDIYPIIPRPAPTKQTSKKRVRKRKKKLDKPRRI